MRIDNLFLTALVLTIVIETVVLFLLLKIFFKKDKIRLAKILFTGFICSFATLPYLWFLLPDFIGGNSYIIIGESLVILFESFMIWQILNIKYWKSFILSLVCNAVSYSAGLVLIPLIFS
jgi:predicted neutral ceramidase superfamily lipid hydrolase